MKKLLLLLFSIVNCQLSLAQKEANTWYFGANAGLDFNSGAPFPIFNGQLNTNEGCATISDKTTGALLFYTDGLTIWDRTHTMMLNGGGLLGDVSSTQSAIIVPLPNSTTQYYVFTVDLQAGYLSLSGFGGMAYSIVDITGNGGLGAVTVKNVMLATPTAEKVTAARHCNGRDIWVVTHLFNSQAFYAYLLTPAGLNAPVITNIGVVHQDVGSLQNAESIGYMKFSPNGAYLALACYVNLNRLQIFDFNNSTGVFSNTINDGSFPNLSGSDGPYGISFSPDNSRLYVGVFGYVTTNSAVYQYNMLAGNATAIRLSKTLIASVPDCGIGAIQIGPDGKIYIAKSDNLSLTGFSDYIDVINFPNALGVACNYNVNGLYLGGAGVYQSRFGLPDVIESFFITPFTANAVVTGCNGNTPIIFTDSTLSGAISVLWNFGDPASGTADTSSNQIATHTFSGAGTYTVTLLLGNSCGTDTFTQVVTAGGVSIAASADVTICTNDSTPLTVAGAPGGSTIAWNPTVGLSCTNCANPIATPLTSTTYIVSVTDTVGCSSTDTVVVIVNPLAVLTVTPIDTTICWGSAVQLQASGGTNYLWSPSLGLSDTTIANPLATPLDTTVYTVSLPGTCGNPSATVTINVIPPPNAPTIIQSGDTLFCVPAAFATYQWYYGSTLITGATNYFLIATFDGNYNLVLTDDHGCQVGVGILNVLTGVKGFDVSGLGFEVYPNPARDKLYVTSYTLYGSEISFGIYNSLGQEIYFSAEKNVNGKFSKEIPLKDFADGIYVVQIKSSAGIVVKKFIIEK